MIIKYLQKHQNVNKTKTGKIGRRNVLYFFNNSKRNTMLDTYNILTTCFKLLWSRSESFFESLFLNSK